jgi:hypothetical protein
MPRYRPFSICQAPEAGLRPAPAIARLSFIAHFNHFQPTEGRPRQIPVLRGVDMPDSMEERLNRIEGICTNDISTSKRSPQRPSKKWNY